MSLFDSKKFRRSATLFSAAFASLSHLWLHVASCAKALETCLSLLYSCGVDNCVAGIFDSTMADSTHNEDEDALYIQDGAEVAALDSDEEKELLRDGSPLRTPAESSVAGGDEGVPYDDIGVAPALDLGPGGAPVAAPPSCPIPPAVSSAAVAPSSSAAMPPTSSAEALPPFSSISARSIVPSSAPYTAPGSDSATYSSACPSYSAYGQDYMSQPAAGAFPGAGMADYNGSMGQVFTAEAPGYLPYSGSVPPVAPSYGAYAPPASGADANVPLSSVAAVGPTAASGLAVVPDPSAGVQPVGVAALPGAAVVVTAAANPAVPHSVAPPLSVARITEPLDYSREVGGAPGPVYVAPATLTSTGQRGVQTVASGGSQPIAIVPGVPAPAYQPSFAPDAVAPAEPPPEYHPSVASDVVAPVVPPQPAADSGNRDDTPVFVENDTPPPDSPPAGAAPGATSPPGTPPPRSPPAGAATPPSAAGGSPAPVSSPPPSTTANSSRPRILGPPAPSSASTTNAPMAAPLRPFVRWQGPGIGWSRVHLELHSVTRYQNEIHSNCL